MTDPSTEDSTKDAHVVTPEQGLGLKKAAFSLVFVLGLVMVVLLLFLHYCPWFQERYGITTAQSLNPLIASVRTLEKNQHAIMERLTALEAKSETSGSHNGSTTVEDSTGTNSVALQAVEKNIAALTTKVTALDQSLQSSGNQSLQQLEGQRSLKQALAFMALRDKALSGHSFEKELLVLKELSKDNNNLQASLDKISPLASRGVETMTKISEQFFGLESSLGAALRRASAETWQERIVAELSSLVTVHPLHGRSSGDSPTILVNIENKLGEGDLDGILEDIKTLPSEAQSILTPWHLAVENRRDVEQTLKEIEDTMDSLKTKGAP